MNHHSQGLGNTRIQRPGVSPIQTGERKLTNYTPFRIIDASIKFRGSRSWVVVRETRGNECLQIRGPVSEQRACIPQTRQIKKRWDIILGLSGVQKMRQYNLLFHLDRFRDEYGKQRSKSDLYVPSAVQSILPLWDPKWNLLDGICGRACSLS